MDAWIATQLSTHQAFVLLPATTSQITRLREMLLGSLSVLSNQKLDQLHAILTLLAIPEKIHIQISTHLEQALIWPTRPMLGSLMTRQMVTPTVMVTPTDGHTATSMLTYLLNIGRIVMRNQQKILKNQRQIAQSMNI